MKKRKKLHLLLAAVIGSVLGLTAGHFEDSYIVQCIRQDRLLEYYAVTLGVLLAALLLHTVIHESGHLIFGLLTGYRFSSFRIGSLMLMKEKGKLVLRRHSIPGTSGQCLMAPPELRYGKMPVVLYNLGGSIANLIFSILFFWMMILMPTGSVWAFVWGLMAVTGLASALLNVIPRENGAVVNDGYNTRSLLRDPESVRAMWIQLEISHRQTQGERIAEMPSEWFDMPKEAQMQNNLIAFLAVARSDRLADEGKLEEADELMASLLAGENAIAPVHKGLLQMQRLWLEIMRENRPDVVKSLLTDELKGLMKAMKRYPPVIRVEYALAMLVDRNGQAAKKCLSRFDRAAKWFAFQAQIEGERKLLEVIREKAKEPA